MHSSRLTNLIDLTIYIFIIKHELIIIWQLTLKIYSGVSYAYFIKSCLENTTHRW